MAHTLSTIELYRLDGTLESALRRRRAPHPSPHLTTRQQDPHSIYTQ